MSTLDLGDAVVYRKSDPLRMADIVEYPAIVVSSQASDQRGPKYRIEYTCEDGRIITSWVQAKRLRAR